MMRTEFNSAVKQKKRKKKADGYVASQYNCILQGKNFEKTEITELEIAAENEEKLFQCVNGKALTGSTPKLNSVKVAVKVMDVNDPPEFKKRTEFIYRNENGEPGDVLFVPEVKDEDSNLTKIRCG